MLFPAPCSIHQGLRELFLLPPADQINADADFPHPAVSWADVLTAETLLWFTDVQIHRFWGFRFCFTVVVLNCFCEFCRHPAATKATLSH